MCTKVYKLKCFVNGNEQQLCRNITNDNRLKFQEHKFERTFLKVLFVSQTCIHAAKKTSMKIWMQLYGIGLRFLSYCTEGEVFGDNGCNRLKDLEGI